LQDTPVTNDTASDSWHYFPELLTVAKPGGRHTTSTKHNSMSDVTNQTLSPTMEFPWLRRQYRGSATKVYRVKKPGSRNAGKPCQKLHSDLGPTSVSITQQPTKMLPG
jgi:hypothetical protein